MNILIIGSGGREHALGWKINQSRHIGADGKLFFSPGNAGTASIGTNAAIDLKNHQAIINFCTLEKIELVVIAPDDYLAEGLADSLTAAGIKAFGPTKAASKLEWSKSYAKEFMIANGIPTAAYKVFTGEEGAGKAEALAYAAAITLPIVIKADGLALGKGVVIAETHEDAVKTIEEMMSGTLHGDAGRTVVIEEYLTGREISTHAFCDGETGVLFPSAQDHKRIGEGDVGPNTGGMGTVAPLSWMTDEIMQRIQKEIIEPTLVAMRAAGTPFKGILFPGIMITEQGPKVIEFNARFGDPETQSYMRFLKTDLVDVMLSCIDGTLSDIQASESTKIKWNDGAACCVVLASGGYPGAYEKGIEIIGLEAVNNVGTGSGTNEIIFHAGTKTIDGKTVTSGGRVLGVTAVGANLHEALDKAYKAAESINFKGKQFRRDIGQKSL